MWKAATEMFLRNSRILFLDSLFWEDSIILGTILYFYSVNGGVTPRSADFINADWGNVRFVVRWDDGTISHEPITELSLTF